MAKTSQITKVKAWLESGRTLNSLQALEHGMGMRLSGHIYVLRHNHNMDIIDVGEKHFSEYKLQS